jgi:hypothetical protein
MSEEVEEVQAPTKKAPKKALKKSADKKAPKKASPRTKALMAAETAIELEAGEPLPELVPSDEPVTELVVATSQSISSEAIEAAVAKVKETKRLATICYWEFGRAILACYENDLWKQVRGMDGQPRYKGFSQFCEGELGLVSQHCYGLMRIATTFSAQDVAEIGVAKLGIMCRLSESDRVKLLDEVRKGVPYSDLAEQVKSLTSGYKAPEVSPATGNVVKTAAATTAAAARKKERHATSKDPVSQVENVITCTHDITRSKIPLFVVQSGNVDGSKPPKRATRLADDPWGEEISCNGITIRYSVASDSEGRLMLTVERRRS